MKRERSDEEEKKDRMNAARKSLAFCSSSLLPPAGRSMRRSRILDRIAPKQQQQPKQ